jgi:adenosylmethionine-8-amino-7-oxononanoate aminotransferase
VPFALRTASCLPTGCATGTEGDLVMVAPPFVITEEQVAELSSILDRSLSDLGL